MKVLLHKSAPTRTTAPTTKPRHDKTTENGTTTDTYNETDTTQRSETTTTTTTTPPPEFPSPTTQTALSTVRRHEPTDTERKRKATTLPHTNPEPKPKLPPLPPSHPTTTSTTPTPSPTGLPHPPPLHPPTEPELHDDKRRRTMGRYYRSEPTDDVTAETSSTTSTSSSSLRHRVRVRSNCTEDRSRVDPLVPSPPPPPPAEPSSETVVWNRSDGESLEHTVAHGGISRGRERETYKPSATTTRGVLVVGVEREEERRKRVDEEEEAFRMALKKRGLEMVEQEGDGNCLFRAVSLQVYGDPEVHMDVRRRCLDFMAKDEAHFSEFVVDEPFMQYILRKRQNGVHGNNPEIQAISELYNRPVEVFVPSNGATPINIFQSAYKTCDAPLRLSYHDGNHYNAVTDPLCPTAGLGLGLPGLEPGLADKLQLQKAVDESEDLHLDRVCRESHEMDLQKAILESKRDSGKGFEMYYEQKAALMSDMEVTDFELEQTALVDSLKSHYGNEAGRKQPPQRSRERRRHAGGYSSSASSRNFSSRDLEASESSAAGWSTSFASPLVASLPAAADAVSTQDDDIPAHLLSSAADEYPQTVQELVMNGFALERVVKAYDLIGDNFNDLLTFLMNSGNGS